MAVDQIREAWLWRFRAEHGIEEPTVITDPEKIAALFVDLADTVGGGATDG